MFLTHSFSLTLLLSVVLASPTHYHKRASLSVYDKCTKSNEIALTFDDGPYNWLRQISDAFTKAGGKATFFFNGLNYDCIYNTNRIADIQYAYNAGHQMASHSWSHPDLQTLSTAQLHDNMYRLEEALSRIAGVRPAFLRPPYGSWSTNVRDVAFLRGQSLALWDWDAGDAVGNTTDQSKALYKHIADSKVSNANILEHETIETTATVLVPYAIDLFKGKGYKLVTLAECVGQAPYAEVGIAQTPDASWTCTDAPAPGQGCGGSVACKSGTPVVAQPPSTPSGKPIHPNGSTSKCLTAPTNTNGAKLEISDCISGATSQSWTVDGSSIKIYGDKCVDVPGGSGANGTRMQIWTCSSSNRNQKWTTSSGVIQWSGSTFCLDNKSGALTNGNPTQLWTCRGNTNQIWTVGSSSGGSTSSGSKTVRPSASTTTCLTASSNTDGATVVIKPCGTGLSSQSWKVSGATLVVYGNKCLDVPSGTTANGTKLQIWTCGTNNANQQFTVGSEGRITWKKNGSCVDLSGGSLTSGNRVQIWTPRDNNPNQIWNFV